MPAAVMQEPSFLLTEAISEAISQELSAKDLISLDIDRDTVRQTVEGLEAAIASEAAVEMLEYETCLTIRVACAEAGQSAWRRVRIIRYCALILVFPGLLGIHSLFELNWPIHYLTLSHSRTRDTLYSLLIIAGSCVLFGITSFTARIATKLPAKDLSLAESRVKASEARRKLAGKVRAEVARFVRVTINNLQAEAEQLSGALLTTTQAPRLVELDTSESLAFESLSTVEEFIRGHSTSAIGIAGTRGVGKTTTIRHISTSKHDESIGTYIEAPVYYDAADFVRLIHAKVAESILRANRHTYIDPLKRTPIYSALLRLAIAFIGALIGFILIVAAQNDTFLLNRSQYVVGSLFITGSIVLAFSVLNILPQRSSAQMRRQRRFDAVSLARDALKSLRWQATVDTKATTRLKMFSILETEDTSDTSLAERERAHPERVADFKDFIRSYHETLHALPLVIAIDELDKIASAEKALELVNGLKDILHLTNTHFVVSVSEDALNSFALRGVPVRDVFDSSFDTVIHLRPLSAQESITLLKGRVVGFPESAALLCHVLSGGLPRDLIRAARRCIDQRRAADKPIPVHKLGQEVPRLELLDVIEAALRVRRFAEKTAEQKDVDTWLLRLREELRSGSAPMTGNTFEILKEGADLCASLSSASEIENILCIAAVLCTASQFTAVQRTSEEWMSLLDESGTQRGIELLAEARMAAATFPAQCRSQVREARQSLGLMPDLIL